MIRKFIELKDLKTSDRGPGTIEGYRSVFSIDEGGDLIVKGAFADTVGDYLNSGFTAHSHEWSFKEAIGFPISAHEDHKGFYVVSQFHSTPDAQAIRTKAKERLEAGKQVGFSFGYSPLDFTYIDARDYEKELPKYVKAADLQYNMQQAKKFPKIRLIKRLAVYEDSLVTAPMNRQAAATGVKSRRSDQDVQLNADRIRIRAKALIALYSDPETDYLRERSLIIQARVRRALMR